MWPNMGEERVKQGAHLHEGADTRASLLRMCKVGSPGFLEQEAGPERRQVEKQGWPGPGEPRMPAKELGVFM